MSLTTKQEHVTTTCTLCMISKRHKQRGFHSASPRPRALCLASPRLRTLLPCLASASTFLPWPLPLPWQNCLEPIPFTTIIGCCCLMYVWYLPCSDAMAYFCVFFRHRYDKVVRQPVFISTSESIWQHQPFVFGPVEWQYRLVCQ